MKRYNYLNEEIKMPPLGLRPKFVVERLREKEILEAMNRYIVAGVVVPFAWLEELNELLEKHNE
jgi:hypothetical protein